MERAKEIVEVYAQSYREDFQRRRQVEARFEIPARDCVISGSIDLLLKEDDQGQIVEAEVIDFKAIEGGMTPNKIRIWTGPNSPFKYNSMPVRHGKSLAKMHRLGMCICLRMTSVLKSQLPKMQFAPQSTTLNGPLEAS